MPEERTSGTKRKKTQNARTLLTSSRIQRLVDRRTVARSKPVDTTASDAAGGYAVPFKELGNNGEVLLLPGSPTFFPSPLCSTVSSVSSRNSNSRRSQGKSFLLLLCSFARSVLVKLSQLSPLEGDRRKQSARRHGTNGITSGAAIWWHRAEPQVSRKTFPANRRRLCTRVRSAALLLKNEVGFP